jgi:hypothetical protein
MGKRGGRNGRVAEMAVEYVIKMSFLTESTSLWAHISNNGAATLLVGLQDLSSRLLPLSQC